MKIFSRIFQPNAKPIAPENLFAKRGQAKSGSAPIGDHMDLMEGYEWGTWNEWQSVMDRVLKEKSDQIVKLTNENFGLRDGTRQAAQAFAIELQKQVESNAYLKAEVRRLGEILMKWEKPTQGAQ